MVIEVEGELDIPQNYRGREQAFIKHRLLETYLERLFMIIGQHQSQIRYVDCFSGPWQEESHDLDGTSIALALRIMQKCHDGFRERGRTVRFHALFIEKNPRAYQRLQSFLEANTPPGIETTALHGEFYDLRQDILEWCGPRDFTFFFIDPFGWKGVVELPTLEPLLKRPNSEFLINFMYDFLLRTHTQEPFRQDMEAIFGEALETSEMSPGERERYLIGLFRQRLKEISPKRSGRPRTACVPVLYPLRDRTLYHLVYLSRHPKGIVVFMKASESLELVQKKIRAQAKRHHRETRTGQGELFDLGGQAPVDEQADPEEVKAYWLKKLTAEPRPFGIEALADILEETDWFERDLQAALRGLIAEGLVENLDARRRRPVNAVNFEKNERLIRVEQ